MNKSREHKTLKEKIYKNGFNEEVIMVANCESMLLEHASELFHQRTKFDKIFTHQLIG